MIESFVTELRSFKMPIGLVVDGAIVPNIDIRLQTYGLNGRPLFRETAHRATVLAGPWLVWSEQDQSDVKRMVEAARSFGKGVFWLGLSNEEGLFSHLRRLGAARMPDDRVLYFRHYDSDVLAAVAPLLDAQQAALLFGPFEVIALVGGSANGASVQKPKALPDTGSYPIRFEAWQIAVLDDRQKLLSRKKIAKMLRNEFDGLTDHIPDDGLLVDNLCDEAISMNMKKESSQARWCVMHYVSNGRLNREFIDLDAGDVNRDATLSKFFSNCSMNIPNRESLQEYFR